MTHRHHGMDAFRPAPMWRRLSVVAGGWHPRPRAALIGEIGLVEPESRRTQSFECLEAGELLAMSYDRVREIYFQNPQFGFYFLKLVARRLLANTERLEARLEATVGGPASREWRAAPG